MHRRPATLHHDRKAALSNCHAYLHSVILVSCLMVVTSSALQPAHVPIAAISLYILAQMYYWYLCKRENARRDKLAADGHPDAIPQPASAEDNRTDLQDLAFRYVL